MIVRSRNGVLFPDEMTYNGARLVPVGLFYIRFIPLETAEAISFFANEYFDHR